MDDSTPADLTTRPGFGPGRRRGVRLVVGVALAGVLLGSTGPAQAARDEPGKRLAAVEAELERSRDELADITAESAQALLTLRRTRAASVSARDVLLRARAAEQAAAGRLVMTQARLDIARSRVEQGEAELVRLAVDVDTAQVRRDNLARIAYEGGAGSELAAAIDIVASQRAIEGLAVLDHVTDEQRAVLADLAAAQQRAQARQIRLEADRREVAALALTATSDHAAAKAANDAARAAATRLHELAVEQEAAAKDLAARRAQEEQRARALEGESERLERELAAYEARRAQEAARRAATERSARATSAGATRSRTQEGRSGGARTRSGTASSSAALANPVGAPVTSGFGLRFHPILHYSRLHAGLDYGAGCGTPVRAAADGQIVRAGWSGGYGNVVVVAHDGPLSTTYAHLESVARSGGRVSRGDVIGRVGTTGLSTGCHLHFEARRGGAPVDPRRFL